ncbi:PREDICTED: mast cell-expressed membrane protein 1 isoform X1 [Hipposideros armiger]|uniref:Mast cell-expressed membrane protein 1 isoform X1 n=1 Tax=Hipposideros armiger TaxID=186990 RepID=A0A8B7THE1_HIPAR|nr:PREDICTED: mast cell-expressed membrane protein 1 isoform X1 [Hipposideros armiger]
MCGQIGTLGTMEAEEIYMNQEARMQAAASKDKQRGTPDNKKAPTPELQADFQMLPTDSSTDVHDPDYENITLAFRNRDQPKGCHASPKNKVPTRSRPSSDSAQVPHWLHRAIMSLYILLALFCIILLAYVLVKNSEMSQELLVLKKELSNVSNSTQECQEEQKQGWNNVKKSISETKKLIDTVNSNVQNYHKKVGTLPADIGQIKTQLDKISEKLQNLQTQKPAAP